MTNVMTNIDALMKRKLELAQRKEICDAVNYAEEWNQLAAEFEALSMESNAADCRARWMWYRDLKPGAYIRAIEVPFAETIPLEEAQRIDEVLHVNVWM